MKVEFPRQRIFTMDVEKSIENAVEFSKLLSKHKLHGEFYICGLIVAEHAAECRKIAARHFIGGHGFRHESFSRLPVNEQQRLIEKTKNTMEENGIKMQGWRFPNLRFTSASLQLLADAGIFDSSMRINVLQRWKSLYFLRNWIKLMAVDGVYALPRPFPSALIEKPFSAVDLEDGNFFRRSGRVITHCYNLPKFQSRLEKFLAAGENNNYNNQ